MSQEESVNAAWGTPLHVFYCAHCHSAHLAPVDVTLPTCPACLQAATSPQAEYMRREPPELVIPFAVGEQRVADALTAWARGVWFRPAELRADALLARVQRYYFPLWLVDCDVEATWQAEMGYDYQAASFRERYADGRWISQEVTETRTRWEPRVGRLERHYDNVIAPALETHARWMSRLGGYDFRTRQAYAPRAIAHSAVRVPDYAPDAAWMDAEAALRRTAEGECRMASEADHARNWATRARYQNLHWTQMLAPAYMACYREGERLYPVWINGQSGHVYGIKRMSQHKATVASLVTGGVAALGFLVGVLLATLGAALVAPLAVGTVLIAVSLLLGLLAPIPATWVWIRNRRAERQASELV